MILFNQILILGKIDFSVLYTILCKIDKSLFIK